MPVAHLIERNYDAPSSTRMISVTMTNRTRGWLCIAAASCALAGCTVDNASTASRDGDPVLFAAQVQPLVQRHCAFEGCHGREGMPLTLYAVDFLRLRDPAGNIDPAAPPLDERSLSEVELEHNRRALAARTSASDPAGDGVILRLVPISEGGIPHADTVVYPSLTSPEIAVFRRFLGTTYESP